jgi:thiol-disulfide isomerase/thioredoxin
MRSAAVHLAALFIAALSPLAARAEDDQLTKIITALRAAEAKYRDVDDTIQITTRKADPAAPGGFGAVTSEETRRVVLQGDHVYFRSDLDQTLFSTAMHKQEVSAYDGKLTRTVVSDNCVNMHEGRYEHPDVYPVHTIPLIHFRVNFPLSVYLSGTDAIHAHPKYGDFVRESGSIYEFTKVEASLDGEEEVDGLRCHKIRCRRWYYSRDVPALQYLWLAPERNYLCVKEQLFAPKSPIGELPTHEMHVDQMREVEGTWFPMKVTVIQYDGAAMRQKKHVAASRTEIVAKHADLKPHHDLAFFRDIEIPKGLPVFLIEYGALVGSAMPEPVKDEVEEKAKLAEIVAKVRAEEERYAQLEVKARVQYRHVGDAFNEGLFTDQKHGLRSVVQGPLAYYSSHEVFQTFGGARSEGDDVQAFDGQWTRSVHRATQDGQKEQRSASLRKGGEGKAEGRQDHVPVLRPHTFLVRDDWLYGPLADLLVSPWHDKVNKYRLRFRYCGEDSFDDHPCVKLLGEVTTREGQPAHNYMAFWLATDRNYIPVKLEHYGGNFGVRRMPAGISTCGDFREISPGVWYPYRSTLLSFNPWIPMAQRRITLIWKRVYEVESVTVRPTVNAALFHDIVVPAGTEVQVSDEDRRYVGQFKQKDEGVAEIAPARYLELLTQAKVDEEEQKARQRAIDALIGQPAPGFPEGAKWLSSKPLTWKVLKGKVVILDFWAEWCAPCRNDLPQLSLLHQERESNGLTVIGVHPPGSEPEAIKKVMDEYHVEYPICVDVPPGPQTKALGWGDFFGRFAVYGIPHAVAIGSDGKILACGSLQDVVTKARKAASKRE